MSTAPRPVESLTREVRESARRQADRFSGGGGWALFASAAAMAVMLVVIVLDYYFNQEPTRLIKVFAGATAFGAILMAPKYGLLVLPVAMPFLTWIPPLPVPGMNATNILLFSIFGMFALGHILARQPVFRPTRLGPWILALIALAGLSIVRGAAFPTGYSYNAGAAAIVLFRSAVTFATYFIVLAMTRGRAERRRVAWAVVLGLLAETLITIKFGRNGSGGRAVGSLGQSNELGGFLALFAVLPVALLPATRHWFGKTVLAATAVLSCFATVLTLSRGSLVALVVGLGVVAFRTSRLLTVLLAVVLVSSPLWAPDYLVDRIMESRQNVEGSDATTVDGATESRVETWRSILQVVGDHPLDGVGWTGLGYVLPDIGNAMGLEDVKDSSHNTYLRMLSEMGILGLLLFIVLLWKAWKLGDDTIRIARDPFDRALGVGACGAVASIAISCAFGDRFFGAVVAGNMWVYLAVVEDAWIENRRVTG